MQPLRKQDLWSLEDYARHRVRFRQQVMQHKQPRRIAIGPHAMLYFEDRLTIQYQIQEILRAEKIFEPTEIEAELATYNPLIPGERSLSATFMLEYEDPQIRQTMLTQLVGIEHHVWIQLVDFKPVFALADEDLIRSTEHKTSAVHFLRFCFTQSMVQQFLAGPQLILGIDHPNYSYTQHDVPVSTLQNLVVDLS